VVTEPERICVLEMDSDEQERVPGAVLSLIEHRRYEPGDRLPSECELAERFSVGRRALREALAKLENMRLIERRKNSGVFLTRSPHMTSLETLVLYSDLGLPQDKRVNAECVKVRRIIEVQAIRLACERRSEEDITKLKQTNSAFSETSAGPLITSALDYEFHIDIFRATRNAVLLRLVTPFYMISRTRRELFSAEPARCRASHKQHVGMVRAIQERDADRAEALMVKHIGRVERYFDSVPG
jgi:GntR family transcriptional repressor for pyruvate dehydrogenase complex